MPNQFYAAQGCCSYRVLFLQDHLTQALTPGASLASHLVQDLSRLLGLLRLIGVVCLAAKALRSGRRSRRSKPQLSGEAERALSARPAVLITPVALQCIATPHS